MAVVAVPFILYLVRFCSSKSCKILARHERLFQGNSKPFVDFQALTSYAACCRGIIEPRADVLCCRKAAGKEHAAPSNQQGVIARRSSDLTRGIIYSLCCIAL